MAIINCPECNSQVSDRASCCPRCGYPLSAKQTPPPPPRQDARKTNYYYTTDNGFSIDNFLSGGSRPFYHSDMSKSELIKQFMFCNSSKFPGMRLQEVENILMSKSEQEVQSLVSVNFKSPDTMLIISVLVGYLGIDRFLLGETLNGALKLILTICCGLGLVWWIVDLFLIQNLTRDYNFRQFLNYAGLTPNFPN